MNVVSFIADLLFVYAQDSVAASDHWHRSFAAAAKAIALATPKRPWNMDPTGVFARLDVFVQRCR